MSKQRSAFNFIFFFAWGLVFVLSTNASADYAAAVLADNPLGYWRFNDPPGDTAANSGTAGSELDGEYIDVQRVPGPDVVDGKQITGLGDGNQAISVGDDLPSYVAVDASPMNDIDSESGFTFEGWVNAGPRDQNRIGLWGQNDVPEFGFIQPFRIQLWTPGGGNVNWDFTEDDIEDDTWFHIAATSNFDETILYINGEEVMIGPGQPNDTFGFSDFTFNIGGGGVYDPIDANNGNQFLGLIDEVAIWTDRTLTEEEINAHFQAAFVDTDPCKPLNDGTLTDPAERLAYVHDVLGTWMGDSNKDGVFGSGDLVAVFTAGKFETGEAATWEEGDWSGDQVFSSGDLVVAFQDGGFEVGPRPQAAAVPEPTSLLILPVILFGLLSTRRRKR